MKTTTDGLDAMSDADLRVRALLLLGYRRYRWHVTGSKPIAFIDHASLALKRFPYDPDLPGGGQVECGDDVPLARDGIRYGTPDPVRNLADAMALVEVVRPAHWHPDARLEIYPPDSEGYYVAFAWDGYDGRETEADADGKTLPRALTVLAVRLAALRGPPASVAR